LTKFVPSPEAKAAAVSSELRRASSSIMVLQYPAWLGSIMATSEPLLTVIAIRLAVLVIAGLVAKTAAADHPGQEIGCAAVRTAVTVQAPPAAKPEADKIMRDMLLHD
jgi:hypothetical protein